MLHLQSRTLKDQNYSIQCDCTISQFSCQFSDLDDLYVVRSMATVPREGVLRTRLSCKVVQPGDRPSTMARARGNRRARIISKSGKFRCMLWVRLVRLGAAVCPLDPGFGRAPSNDYYFTESIVWANSVFWCRYRLNTLCFTRICASP